MEDELSKRIIKKPLLEDGIPELPFYPDKLDKNERMFSSAKLKYHIVLEYLGIKWRYQISDVSPILHNNVSEKEITSFGLEYLISGRNLSAPIGINIELKEQIKLMDNLIKYIPKDLIKKLYMTLGRLGEGAKLYIEGNIEDDNRLLPPSELKVY